MFSLIIISLIMAVVWVVGAKLIFKKEITIQESAIQLGISLLTIIAGAIWIYKADTGDTLILNGQVTGKDSYHVSCSHSYPCRCRTTTIGKTTSTTCDTCYMHLYDVDWRVKTSVGNLLINRVDLQGVRTPPRWDSVEIGEPAAVESSYTNYVKASPNSLFAMNKKDEDVQKYPKMFPNYPRVYDYYRVNHVLQIQTTYPEAAKLNEILSNELRALGPVKQSNVIVAFVNSTDPMYRFALERHWIGGKKNDIIVLIGLDKEKKFSWVDTITFANNSGNALMTVKIRDDIKKAVENQQFGLAEALAKAILPNVQSDFHRKEMNDFKYLDDAYSPSGGALFWFSLVQLLIMIASTAVVVNNNEREYSNNGRYRRPW